MGTEMVRYEQEPVTETTAIQEQIDRLVGTLGSMRMSSLQAVIAKSFLAGREVPLEGLPMLTSIQAWQEVLEDIPTSKIDLYYRLAAKEKTNGYPVSAFDIVATWNKYAEMRHNYALIGDYETY